MRLDDPVALIGYFLLACFWAVISTLLVFLRRAWRAQRPIIASLLGLIIAVLLWGGLFIGATPGSAALHRYLWTEELFGCRFYLPSPRLSYRDPGLIEIYWSKVFDLPDSLARWLNAPPPEFLANFPVESDTPGRKRLTWRSTPAWDAPSKLLRHFEFRSDPDEEEKGEVPSGWEQAEKAEALRQELISEQGNYYAADYSEDHGSVVSAVFYVISPKRRLLIAVGKPY